MRAGADFAPASTSAFAEEGNLEQLLIMARAAGKQILIPPGALGGMDALSAVNLNVEYMYAFVSRATEKAVVVFRFEDAAAAIETLKNAGISILPAETVYTL